MRRFIIYIVRKRNPKFQIHPSIHWHTLLAFVWQQICCLIRGCRVLLAWRNPKKMLRGKGVRLSGISYLHWGSYLKLGDLVYVSAAGKEGITLGNNVGIGAFSRLIVSSNLSEPGAYIRIGNNVGIGEYAYLGGAGGLQIGSDTIVGQYFSCHPENHHCTASGIPIRLQGVFRKGIRIGTNCWIGSKVSVLDGVTIGNNCVVAAGSVVTKSFPDNCIIGGVPARKLKDLDSDPVSNIKTA